MQSSSSFVYYIVFGWMSLKLSIPLFSVAILSLHPLPSMSDTGESSSTELLNIKMIKKRHHFLQLVFVDCHKVTCWVCVFKEAAIEGISETSSQVEHLCQRSKCSLAVAAVLLLERIPGSETLVNHHLPVLGEKDADTCAQTDHSSESRCNAAASEIRRKNTCIGFDV